MKLNEPTEYDAEFFYSKKEIWLSIILGAFLTVSGTVANFEMIQDSATTMWVTALIAGGIFFEHMGIRELINRQPKLKLAKKGLWTKQLGFIDWNDVTNVKLIVTSRRTFRFSRYRYLEIYLKNSFSESGNQIYAIIGLTHVENIENIEIIIDDLRSKRNMVKR